MQTIMKKKIDTTATLQDAGKESTRITYSQIPISTRGGVDLPANSITGRDVEISFLSDSGVVLCVVSREIYANQPASSVPLQGT